MFYTLFDFTQARIAVCMSYKGYSNVSAMGIPSCQKLFDYSIAHHIAANQGE